MKTPFNDGWKFAKFHTPDCRDNVEYASISVPHDWLIYNARDLYETSYGRYVKTYNFGNLENQSVRLYFEGVYMNCTIFVNGKSAADWKYGYTSFEVDITGFLHDGENEIVVLVRHEAPNSRWYSGAGIIRNVWLIKTPSARLETDGIYFHAEKHGKDWFCTVSAEAVNSDALRERITLSAPGGVLYSTEIRVGGKAEFTLSGIDKEYIWDIDSPNLLTLSVALIGCDKTIDELSCRAGLREIEYKPDSGFYLNGRHVKINGVCLHHDLGCLGAAFNKSAEKRRLLKMREMGANAVRTSHNPPAPGFMELCDELGILVDSEAFDMWERSKTEYDYARFFDEWYKKDVASWIRRDRNHPSVIMWSIGNEIYDTHVSPRGREVARLLHAAVREHDPLCNAPTTIGSNYMAWDGAQSCALEVDLAGYNYGEELYLPHHEKYPGWRIYGSETTAGVKSRGVYHFPLSSAYLTHDDLQCSSLGNCKAGISALTAQEVIEKNRGSVVCAGMFIWTGSDYIGEPTPYSTKNSYFGSIDTAGIEKDSFYLYRAAWTNEPVLHLMPYWDYNEGQLIDVVAYTNLSEVELFVNGKSVGKKQPSEYTAAWQVPYEKGEIKAVGTTADGALLTDTKHSFGDSARLILTAERTDIAADGDDAAVIIISTVDRDGYPVENARDRVSINVFGGRLLGFDNGDSTDFDSYKSTSRRLFSGKAAAYIASGENSGVITVTATAPGMKCASITLNSHTPASAQSVRLSEEILDAPLNAEIPMRKIELTRNGDGILTGECPSRVVRAHMFPKNATYSSLCWSAVTDSGIASNLASVKANGDYATVYAIGDGHFRLRCSCDNGKKQPEVISELEFTVSGMGQPYLDPYSFTPGCLYNYSAKPMDEVQNGGVNLRSDNNIAGFTKVDFGKNGSDGFAVSIINWFSNDRFTFRLWDGIPRMTGSECLGEFIYCADFVWQTYIVNRYKLSKRITGVHDIYFEFDTEWRRIDFGGFRFTPVLKAYEFIHAADHDVIHGDTFEVADSSIKGIGNNVFIEYYEMDFARGTSEITVRGRTRHDNDSIHIWFELESGATVREIVEFPYSDETISVAHKLPDIRGKGKIEFRFLPGSDFDFEGFQISS